MLSKTYESATDIPPNSLGIVDDMPFYEQLIVMLIYGLALGIPLSFAPVLTFLICFQGKEMVGGWMVVVAMVSCFM